ncbi:MAG: histidine--tRNA ligase [Desulfonauticus sp.]|nr:histidine--tRNA ligase [Desulfonauticus sp.]
MSKITKVKGFPDLFPPQSNLYVFMENTARKIFSYYGCEEIRTPILEKTELFARSIGNETDIVQKEMYTFLDKKNRSLTLRPEATAGVVRAFIENVQAKSDEVFKFFTIGPMFRYERPQKGRLRQFHQINVEYFGPQSPQADGELILMLWHYLHALQLNNLSLQINSLGCPQCRPIFEQKLIAFLQTVDEAALCPDCQRRKTTNPLRVLDCKEQSCKQILIKAPTIIDNLCSTCRSHFQAVLDILDNTKIPYQLNHKLVRGLDYYQRTTFEVIATSNNIGAQSAIAGGGRYDGLVKNLGGPDVPGLGFACGMERIALLLEVQNNLQKDFFIAVLSEKCLLPAMSLANKLRHQGLSGEVSFEVKSLKSQLRYANKHNIKICLFFGEDELHSGKIPVKDLETGTQHEVFFEDIITTLKRFLKTEIG